MLRPLGDRVIIEVAKEEEKTVGGTVIAVGEGRTLEIGEKAPVAVNVGEQVMFEKYAGTEVKFEGNEYLIVAAKDIIAVVE